LICLNRTGSDTGVIEIGEKDVAFGIFVDNLIVCGSETPSVRAVHQAMVDGLQAHQLVCGADSIEGPMAVVEYVGLEICGDTRLVFPKGTRVADIAAAARYLASCKMWHGHALQRFLGVLAWMFCLRRPLFVLLGALYQFSKRFRGWAPGWAAGRRKLLAVARLVPLAAVSLAREWGPLEVAQDAEGPNRTDHGGAGVVARALPGEPPATAGLVAGEKHEGVLAWVRRGVWQPVLHRRWRYREHISLGELQAILLWLQRVARSDAWHGRRVLVWTDSAAVHGLLRKGRGRSVSLNTRLRRAAAALLACDLELDVRWIWSNLMPADELSRLRGDWFQPPLA